MSGFIWPLSGDLWTGVSIKFLRHLWVDMRVLSFESVFNRCGTVFDQAVISESSTDYSSFAVEGVDDLETLRKAILMCGYEEDEIDIDWIHESAGAASVRLENNG